MRKSEFPALVPEGPVIVFHRRELRSQVDLLSAEQKKVLFGTVCPPEEDTARQEFKEETSTRNILARYGAGATFGPTQGGTVDYTLDLTEAIRVGREAEEAYLRLPEEVRKEFSSWSELAARAADGGLASWEARVKATKAELELREKAYQAYRASAGSSGEAGKASPSDSAGEGPPKGGQKGDKPS